MDGPICIKDVCMNKEQLEQIMTNSPKAKCEAIVDKKYKLLQRHGGNISSNKRPSQALSNSKTTNAKCKKMCLEHPKCREKGHKCIHKHHPDRCYCNWSWTNDYRKDLVNECKNGCNFNYPYLTMVGKYAYDTCYNRQKYADEGTGPSRSWCIVPGSKASLFDAVKNRILNNEGAICTNRDEWKCYDGMNSPMKRVDGEIACASYNGKDCLWNYCKKNNYDTSKLDFNKLNPLKCGKHHQAQWGGTGYKNKDHWCYKLNELM